MKILVIEDEIKLAEYLKKGLGEAGHNVDIVHNGVDGLHMALEGGYDLLILDEINVALDYKLIPLGGVLDILRSKPKSLELVLTGRNAPRELIEEADLVTEMKEIKHPYHTGLHGRRGIEY